MIRKRVISFKQLPTHLPTQPTCVGYLMMEHFHVGQLGWGIFISLFSVYWIICIISMCTEDKIELNIGIPK